MSTKTDRLKDELHQLEQRIKVASNDHEAAKSTFGRLEVPPTHYLWHQCRDRIDTTLTHLRVLQACWHRTKAQLLDQQNTDHEAD